MKRILTILAMTAVMAWGGPEIQLIKVGEFYPDLIFGEKDQTVKMASQECVKVFESRNAMKIQMPEHKNYGKFMLDIRQDLPEFVEGYLKLSVYTTLNSMTDDVYFRIQDVDGEIFRFDIPVKTHVNGWQNLEVLLHAMTPNAKVENSVAFGNGQIDMPCKFLEIGVDKIMNFQGDFAFGDASFLVDRSPVVPVLVCGSGTDLKILCSGEEKSLGIYVENRSLRDNCGIVSWKIWDDEDIVVASGKEFIELLANKKCFFPIDTIKKYGGYQVELSYMSTTDMRVSRRKFSLVYMPPAGPLSKKQGLSKEPGAMIIGASYVNGECSHADLAADAMMMSFAGIPQVRVLTQWKDFQPNVTMWNLSIIDAQRKIFDKQNIGMTVAVAGCPDWAIDETVEKVSLKAPTSATMPKMEFWNRMMRNFVGYYGQKLTALEIWNLPDSFSGCNFSSEGYAALLKTAKDFTKNTSVSMDLVTGGFVCPVNEQSGNKSMLEDVVKSGNYDYIGISGSGGKDTLERRLQTVKSAGGDGPVVLGASATSFGFGFKEQANEFYKKAVIAKSYGASGFYWGMLRDVELGDQPRHYCGLLTSDGYAKSVLAAVNSFNARLAHATFLEKQEYGTGNVGYVFRGEDDETIVVAWNENGEPGICPMMVTGLESNVRVYDIYGNEEFPVINRGTCTFYVSDSPRLLVAKRQEKRPDVRGAILAPLAGFKVVVGRKNVLTLDFMNPLKDKAIMYTLDIKLPEGIVPDGELPTMCVVNVDSVETLKIPVYVDADFMANYVVKKEMTIGVSAGESWRQDMHYGFESVYEISNQNFDEAAPDFVLRSGEFCQLSSGAVSDVANCSGNDDLSAQGWVKCNGKNLDMKIKVTDSEHVITIDEKIGDNVIIALCPDGVDSPFIMYLSEGKNEKPIIEILTSPKNSPKTVKGAKITLAIDKTASDVTYTLSVPLASIGLTSENSKLPIGFNVRVNDDDGQGLKSYRCLSGGLDDHRLNTGRFLHVILPSK